MTFSSLRHRIVLKRGSDLLRKEQWQQAAPLLDRATKLVPDHWESHNNLAIALLKLGRGEEAAAAAQRAISLDPTASDSHAFFGIALLQMERWEEAVAAYHRAIKVDPNRYDAYERLGMALLRLERWSEVADAYGSALKLNPRSHSAYNMLGIALLHLGRCEDAAAVFRQAIELVQDDPAAAEDLAGLLINLACAVANLHNSEEAVAALRRASALHPSAEARLSLGVELLKLEQWQEAVSELEGGSELAPRMTGFHFLRVDPLIRLGRVQEALASHQRAIAIGGLMPPLPGDPAKARFERRQGAFWTPENLGVEVFQIERWLDQLATVAVRPHSSRELEPPPAAPRSRPARLLFVLDNDYGELTTFMYFILGQDLSQHTTLLLPERLYAHNADIIPNRTHRYRSLDDVMQVVDREKPDIVFLCSGYLLCAHEIFTRDVLERLIQLLRDRGCRVVASDPFLGMLSKQDPRTLISVDIPSVHPTMSMAHLTRAKRTGDEGLWAYFTHAEKILRKTFHLYPTYCDVPANDAAKTDARNIAFFNEKIVRPESHARLAQALLPTFVTKPHWLFILASADYDTQLLFSDEKTFADIVAGKLLETLAAGRHPILIAPSEFIKRLLPRMPTAEGIDILSHCDFTRFMSLLLSAEYAFYWNVVSHSLLIRLYNKLPIVLFDRGHLVRNARPVYDRVVSWYYQGWEPTFRDHREPLTLEKVTGWSEEYRRQAEEISERFRRAPTPEQMIADLMGRDAVPATASRGNGQ